MKKTLVVLLSLCLLILATACIVSAERVNFEPISFSDTRIGAPGDEITRRFLVQESEIPFAVTESDMFKGCVLNGTVTYLGTDDTLTDIVSLKNVTVKAQPIRTDGYVALDFNIPDGVTMSRSVGFDDPEYVYDLTLSMADETNFGTQRLSVSRSGSNGGLVRIIAANDFPFEITRVNQLRGCVIKGTVTYGGTGDYSASVPFNTRVLYQDVRSDGGLNIHVAVPEGYTMNMAGDVYTWDLTISPSGKSASDMPAGETTFVITPDMFKSHLGTYTITTDADYMQYDSVLYAGADPKESAAVTFTAPNSGTYKVYSLTYDYAISTGKHSAAMMVNGVQLENGAGHHGANGYAWELLGEAELKMGENRLLVRAAGEGPGKNSKTAAILFTTADNYTPSVESFHAVLEKDAATVHSMSLSETGTHLYLPYTAFADQLGTFTMEAANGWIKGVTEDTAPTHPATAVIEVPVSGTYAVLGYAVDYSNNGPGTRYAHLSVDGIQLPNKIGQVHRVELTSDSGSAGWTKAGEIYLEAGEHTIGVVDSSKHFARVSGVLLTTDLDFCGFRLTEGNAADYTVATIKPASIADVAVTADKATFMLTNRTDKTIENAILIISLFNEKGELVGVTSQNMQALPANSAVMQSTTLEATAAWKTGKMMIWQSKDTMRPISEMATFAANGSTNVAAVPDVFVSAASFDDFGTWQQDNESGALTGNNLMGLHGNEGVTPEPATIKLMIEKGGTYRIFVRSLDYASNRPGTRFFNMEVNGEMSGVTFGKHGKTGFYWESAGTFYLKEGVTEIRLLDTSSEFARFDGLYITADLSMTAPPNTYTGIVNQALIYATPYNQEVFFPEWAQNTDITPSATTSIASDKVRLTFYTVETPEGTVIQKEMAVDGKVTTSRENNFGALLMYVQEGTSPIRMGQFPLYQTVFEQNGKQVSVLSGDFYKIGESSWLIPHRIQKINDTTVVLNASNAYADAIFKIELKNGEYEPIVTFTLCPKREGQFTANIISGTESESYSHAFLPFRFNGTVLPVASYMVSAPYTTIPMSLKTVKNTNDQTVTTGIALDPVSISKEWPKIRNAEYGFLLRGPKGGVLPTLAMPLYSSENSKMKAGDTYSFTYRMIEQFGEWYPTYQHMVLDVYNLTDYRSNYSVTLNDAIFNTTELAASDKAGWDANQKGYYNIEAENTVTQSNPLVFMSSYLLTEDKNLLEQRTIPSIAYLLTRKGFHYNNGDTATAIYGGIYDLGTYNQNYGNSVYGGGYQMSQGLMPQLAEIGVDNGYFSNIDNYGTSPTYLNFLWLYKYTGNELYLTRAKGHADEFIANRVDAPKDTMYNETSFIAIDFYPQFFGLIDLYEVTGEKKYLDAADRAAKYLLPTVWVYPNSGNEQITISADYLRENHYGKGHDVFWYGKDRLRVGYTPELETLKDQITPFWVVSRAGLSLEQTFTYSDHESGSGNMIMASWAPDLMRLAEYTGNPVYEMYARNAILGRHTTYSGYYYTNYSALNQNERYPYEGPDLTGLYWHHIQPFLAMLQDFLFTQAWNWSNQNIDFPSVRNCGYAYFTNRMYGGEAGKFYDEQDMWLWLKEGIVTTDNIQIDWIAARKDGVAGIAFMNEYEQERTATFTLGDVLANYTGTAAVYDANGNTSAMQITNGQGQITVPGHGILSIVIQSNAVKAPAHANVAVNAAQAGKQTAKPAEGETDTGHILQMTGEEYFAYVYVTESFGNAEQVTLEYKVGNGAWQTADDAYAPFEFIIKVTDPTADFTYRVKKTINGVTTASTQKNLSPLTK